VKVEAQIDDAPLLTGSVPALEVLASAAESGHRLTLLAINKRTTATITATVTISGFTPSPTATVCTLNGPNIAAFNDSGHPTDVKTTETTISHVDQTFPYTFPAHSVTVIEMEKEMAQRQWAYLPLVLRQ
jgi:alpha-L-arabinofuranosidase